MVTRWCPMLACLGAVAFAGCELIGGIDERRLDLAIDAGGNGDGGLDASPDVVDTHCELPATSSAAMRLGHFVTSLAHYDFCVKPSSQSTFDGVTPVILGSGGGCQKGLRYRDVTAAFGLSADTYDIAVVEVSGFTNAPDACGASPVAVINQVQVNEGETVGVFLFGGGEVAPVVKAFKESRPKGVNDSTFRFMHAMPGTGPLDCGMALGDSLPTVIDVAGFLSIGFAGIGAKGTQDLGSVDERGYVTTQIGGGELPFAVRKSGETDAFLFSFAAIERGVSYSAFALGTGSDPMFPPELLICDELKVDGIMARCGGLPLKLSVDSVNTQLNGAFAPFETERRGQVGAAIASLDTDVVCAVETFRKSDRDAIAAAAAGRFPYATSFSHDLDSPVDDPTDQNGATPAAYTAPPCADADAISKLDALLDCVRDNCAQSPGQEDSAVTPSPSNCMSKKCSSKFSALILAGNPSLTACFSCAFVGLASYETMGDVRTACKTDPKARLAFRGDSAVQVLSRYPFDSADAPEAWVLPATEWRVTVIRAPILLGNSDKVDVYCTQLTTPADSITRPYTGQYGNGKTGLAGWQAELLLQTDKLVDFVHKRSGSKGVKAIISGTIYAGPDYTQGSTKILEPVNIDEYNNVTRFLPIAVPEDYVPTCTYCIDNPILTPPGQTATSGASTWQTFNFLNGMPIVAPTAASVVLKDPVVEVTDANGTYKVPISTHYGFRSVVRVVR